MNPLLLIVSSSPLIIGLILGLLTRKLLKTRLGALAHFVTVEIFSVVGGFLAFYLAREQKPELQTVILMVLGGAVLGPVPYLLILRSVNQSPTDKPVHASPVIADQPSRVKPVPTSPVNEVTKSIFVSYRREDSAYITGRIYDTLTAQFGKSAVFKDVDSIPIGVDFRDHISVYVGECAVLVAVIGKKWNPTLASGEPRLNDERDHLRIEIESALQRRIPVIPVLVDGVEMPSEKDLPPSLQRLAYYNGISVRPDPDYHNDVARLARGIEQWLK